MADISKEQAVQLAREHCSEYFAAQVSCGDTNGIWFVDALNAAFKLGRNAGLEEAQQICREINCIQNFEGAVASIESLKDNTP